MHLPNFRQLSIRELLGAYLPPWSALAPLGKSRLLSLTVVTPFLGWLILFNNNIVDLLAISPLALSRWSTSAETVETARSFTLTRLEVAYFGLSFLGIAAFLFNLSCPIIIKKFDNSEKMVEAQQPFLTDTSLTLLIVHITRQFLNRWEGIASKDSLLGLASYPRHLAAHLSTTLEEIFRRAFDFELTALRDDPENSARKTTYTAKFVDTLKVYHPRLHGIDPKGVASFASYRHIKDRDDYLKFDKEAREFENDLLIVNYFTENYSKPLLRLIILSSYGVGFFLLAIPTLNTFWRVTNHAIFGH